MNDCYISRWSFLRDCAEIKTVFDDPDDELFFTAAAGFIVMSNKTAWDVKEVVWHGRRISWVHYDLSIHFYYMDDESTVYIFRKRDVVVSGDILYRYNPLDIYPVDVQDRVYSRYYLGRDVYDVKIPGLYSAYIEYDRYVHECMATEEV